MANPKVSAASESVRHSVHDAANRFAQQMKPEMQEKIKDTLDEARKVTNEALDNASVWLKDNRGSAAAFAGGALAFGLIGFIIGRNSKPSLGDIQDL